MPSMFSLRILFILLLFICLPTKSHGSNHKGTFQFSSSHGDFMVLQREPAAAAVYGNLMATIKNKSSPSKVSVTITNDESKSYYSVDAAIDKAKMTFKALLNPSPAGGSYTIVATCLENDTHADNNSSSVGYKCCMDDCTKSTIKLSNVTFGDVWFCGGQSNMALPLEYTFSRNDSLAAVLDEKEGRYDSIRIYGLYTNMNQKQPWATANQAVESGTFFRFSSTCWYFGESLTDELALYRGGGSYNYKDVPPIGLIHTSEGGTMIEDWLDNKTVYSCHDPCISDRAKPKSFYEERVMEYVDMTIKGWLWYQGENNNAKNCILGNSIRQSGYACLMTKLIGSWRSLWSVVPGTTDPLAPFGVVALPDSASLGHKEIIGTMRWAQTGGYGVLPNDYMPNTFLVQSYDQDDPYESLFGSCWYSGCCSPNNIDHSLVLHSGNVQQCTEKTSKQRNRLQLSCDDCVKWCGGVCASLSSAHVYMGLFHPRPKKGVGMRLARGVMATIYANNDMSMTLDETEYIMSVTGPTLAGCKVNSGGNGSNATLTLLFNRTLLGNDAVVVQEYDTLNGVDLSKLEVLIDPNKFCMQIHGKKCIDDGYGNEFDISDNLDNGWVSVNIKSGSSPLEVVADLGNILRIDENVSTPVYAVRYMWHGNCCNGGPKIYDPNTDNCPLASCPIMGQLSSLPANPFIAKIIDSKCNCIPPMDCSADPSDFVFLHSPTKDSSQKHKGNHDDHSTIIEKHKSANKNHSTATEQLQSTIKKHQVANKKHKASGKEHTEESQYQRYFFIAQVGVIILVVASLNFAWNIRPSRDLEFGFSG